MPAWEETIWAGTEQLDMTGSTTAALVQHKHNGMIWPEGRNEEGGVVVVWAPDRMEFWECQLGQWSGARWEGKVRLRDRSLQKVL